MVISDQLFAPYRFFSTYIPSMNLSWTRISLPSFDSSYQLMKSHTNELHTYGYQNFWRFVDVARRKLRAKSLSVTLSYEVSNGAHKSSISFLCRIGRHSFSFVLHCTRLAQIDRTLIMLQNAQISNKMAKLSQPIAGATGLLMFLRLVKRVILVSCI